MFNFESNFDTQEIMRLHVLLLCLRHIVDLACCGLFSLTDWLLGVILVS